MSNERVEFFVRGTPATAGSKRAFVHQATGKVSLVDTCAAGPTWRTAVQDAATVALRREGLEGPILANALSLDLSFTLKRPRQHYSRAGRNEGQLKRWAPTWHTSKPDATKLTRAIEDALKGVAWRDDSLVCEQHVTKKYGEEVGCYVIIASLV